MENVNDLYFNGHYKDIWRTLIPSLLTGKEIEFIIPYFKLSPSSSVLDLMCGYGRHAIALARQNIHVTAIDNLPEYIAEINTTATTEKLPLIASQENIISFQPSGSFDLALCMGNSLNFFPKHDCIQLLSKIAGCLATNGHLLINSWSLTEIAIKQFVEKSWNEINGLKFLADSKFLFQPTRIETDTIIISQSGEEEHKKAIDYLFSVAEFEDILNQSGFNLVEIFSIPGKKHFALGDPRAYIVAQKR
jgi:SAM-dependent methyltransferase